MRCKVVLEFEPRELIEAYCNNQGINEEQCDYELDVGSILEGELQWLDASNVNVIKLEIIKDETV